MTEVSDGDQLPLALLLELIARTRDGRAITELLSPTVDGDAVRAALRPLTAQRVTIDSIAGRETRVDACLTCGEVVARVVFAHEAGLLTWLHVYLKPPRFEGVSGGRLVVLNGPSGAGKSTLMSAIQSVAEFPLVNLDEPEQIGTVQPGYLIWRDSAPSLHRGYLAAIVALARAGNHVVLAAAGHSQDEIAAASVGAKPICVGLTCDLDVLVERERRTGRWAGIATQSLGVHDGWTYDVEFDTTDNPDPLALAQHVLRLINRRDDHPAP